MTTSIRELEGLILAPNASSSFRASASAENQPKHRSNRAHPPGSPKATSLRAPRGHHRLHGMPLPRQNTELTVTRDPTIQAQEREASPESMLADRFQAKLGIRLSRRPERNCSIPRLGDRSGE